MLNIHSHLNIILNSRIPIILNSRIHNNNSVSIGRGSVMKRIILSQQHRSVSIGRGSVMVLRMMAGNETEAWNITGICLTNGNSNRVVHVLTRDAGDAK